MHSFPHRTKLSSSIPFLMASPHQLFLFFLILIPSNNDGCTHLTLTACKVMVVYLVVYIYPIAQFKSWI
uniref:Uncharacterized protein n=1 Tax=Daphnia magna TaxID=35525 RepID=A0A0P6IAC5_9CRUS